MAAGSRALLLDYLAESLGGALAPALALVLAEPLVLAQGSPLVRGSEARSSAVVLPPPSVPGLKGHENE